MIALFKKLKHSIEWPRKRQFELLRSIIGQDEQWMAHDKLVRTLTKRYLGIMRDDWEHEPILRVDELRDQLGLNPWKTQTQSPSEGVRPSDDTLWDQTLKERDDAHDLIEEVAVFFGCKEEWSSAHSHLDCVLDSISRPPVPSAMGVPSVGPVSSGAHSNVSWASKPKYVEAHVQAYIDYIEDVARVMTERYYNAVALLQSRKEPVVEVPLGIIEKVISHLESDGTGDGSVLAALLQSKGGRG